MPKHKKLTQTERSLIGRWKDNGLSNKECARRLERHPSTIGRELTRNSSRDDLTGRRFYEPLHAGRRASARKKKAWSAKHPLKNGDVYAYILQRLTEGWSPEQIAGRLRLEHPNDKYWHICHESIYRFIYHPDNRDLALWEYLRRGQKKRRRRNGRKVHRLRIPERVSIHQRPKTVDQREEAGHWEGDTVVGRGRVSGLHTEYERVSSVMRIEKMKGLTAEESSQAALKIFSSMPECLRRSTTLDNGSEHAKHVKLKRRLGMETYFADPYCAYQRGGNENANLWIRYYFPKGTDFDMVSDEEIKAVERELNSRPRKRLGFKTPLEALTECLHQEQGLRS
jgi:IS30 family transposase